MPKIYEVNLGIPHDKLILSFKDFEAILAEVKLGRKYVGLHFTGPGQLYNNVLHE